MKKQSTRCRQALQLVTIAVLLSVGGEVLSQENRSIAEKFDAREPRTCADTKAPAGGSITAALAKKYLECQMDYVSGNGNLYLVENVKVEVGGGIPYAAISGQRSLKEINVNHPVYPIRGSFLQYSCRNRITEYSGPPNTNASIYTHTNAKGYCYKTTFGDWSCFMADPDANVRHTVAPPKG